MEQNNKLWKVLTIVFIASTAIFLTTTLIFGFFYMSAEQDFEDQMEVTRLFVEGFDSHTSFEFEESESYLEEAQLLQQEIFERNGMEYSEY